MIDKLIFSKIKCCDTRFRDLSIFLLETQEMCGQLIQVFKFFCGFDSINHVQLDYSNLLRMCELETIDTKLNWRDSTDSFAEMSSSTAVGNFMSFMEHLIYSLNLQTTKANFLKCRKYIVRMTSLF